MGCFSSTPSPMPISEPMILSHGRRTIHNHQIEIEHRKNTTAIVAELYQSWNARKMFGTITCTDYCAYPAAVNHFMNKVGITVLYIHRTRTGQYAPHRHLPGLLHCTYKLTYMMISTSGMHYHTISNPLILSSTYCC